MRNRRKLDRLAAELLGPRLASTVDPLARAKLHQVLATPIDRWADAELDALAEQLAPGTVARAEQRVEALVESLDLANMPLAQLLALAERYETPGDRARNPDRAYQRQQLAAQLQKEGTS